MLIKLFKKDLNKNILINNAMPIKGRRNEPLIVAVENGIKTFYSPRQVSEFTELHDADDNQIFVHDIVMNLELGIESGIIMKWRGSFVCLNNGELISLTRNFCQESMVIGNTLEPGGEFALSLITEFVENNTDMYDVFAYSKSQSWGTPPTAFATQIESNSGYRNQIVDVSYNYNNTTMCLLGIAQSLKDIPNDESVEITIHVADQFLYDVLSRGMIYSWSKNNWIKKTGGKVKNHEAYKEVHSASSGRKIQYKYLSYGTREHLDLESVVSRALATL